jgi:hypothetical protein
MILSPLVFPAVSVSGTISFVHKIEYHLVEAIFEYSIHAPVKYSFYNCN